MSITLRIGVETIAVEASDPPRLLPTVRRAMTTAWSTVATWPARRWMAASAGGVLAALLMGVPTGIIETSFYTRMTPVPWWDYPVWLASATLIGLSLATYVRTSSRTRAPVNRGSSRTVGASLLSVFAIGCPVCNKLVVAVLGFSGALTYFSPIQPLLGLVSLALLVFGLKVRLDGERSCAAFPAAVS